MTDSEKLRYLAAWMDDKYKHDDNRQVQKDLLRIADKIEECGMTGCWMRDNDPRDGLLGRK